MDKWRDLYAVLQLHPDAERDMIQNAYKRLCKKYHPDVNPSLQAAEKMKQINAAYETLGDEAKRRAYHLEWKRRDAQKRAAGPVRVETRERVVYVKSDPPPPDGGTRAAYQVIMDYFAHLSTKGFREAFALVSDADKGNITFEDFVEWQEAVGAVYEIGDFDLRLFKRHPSLKLGPGMGRRSEEYTVSLTEKHKSTGNVRRYSLNKYAVMEGLAWKVYLGYRSLAPLMVQFRMMAATPDEARIASLWEEYRDDHDTFTGLPNRKGFNKSYDVLAYTNKRYGREFSTAVVRAALPGYWGEGGKRELIINYIGYVLANGVRCIDTVASLGGDCFGLLLAETNKKEARLTLRRLIGLVRHDVAACFDFEPLLYAGATECGGKSAQWAIDECMRGMEPMRKDKTGRTGTS